ncbi:MAG: LuxR family transcriptional regulator [Acidimicrobiales bacterium]|nr:MAG: LuxR family transcriptional regulator [Acidimicrobiales bacterium]
MTVPLLVTLSADATATAVRQLTNAGWCVQRGLALPREPWDVAARKLVVTGFAEDQQAVAVVASAAARGAGVVVQCSNMQLAGRMTAALTRIGVVRQELDASSQQAGQQSGLSREQSALLSRLAAGESVATAAEAEFLSLRTANRRLAQARERLGVDTTQQAVHAYIRLIRSRS